MDLKPAKLNCQMFQAQCNVCQFFCCHDTALADLKKVPNLQFFAQDSEIRIGAQRVKSILTWWKQTMLGSVLHFAHHPGDNLSVLYRIAMGPNNHVETIDASIGTKRRQRQWKKQWRIQWQCVCVWRPGRSLQARKNFLNKPLPGHVFVKFGQKFGPL